GRWQDEWAMPPDQTENKARIPSLSFCGWALSFAHGRSSLPISRADFGTTDAIETATWQRRPPRTISRPCSTSTSSRNPSGPCSPNLPAHHRFWRQRSTTIPTGWQHPAAVVIPSVVLLYTAKAVLCPVQPIFGLTIVS